MKNIVFVFSVSLIIAFLSCGARQESNVKTHQDESTQLLEVIQKEYLTDKNDSTLLKLVKTYGQAIRMTTDVKTKESLILNIIDICHESEQQSLALPFEEELNKLSPSHVKNAGFLYLKGESLRAMGKNDMASLFYHGLRSRFPEDERIKDIAVHTSMNFDAEVYIRQLAEKMYVNPDTMGMNYNAALTYAQACQNFAMAYPSDKYAPEYLFRAAEMSRALNMYKPMMYYYNWITDYYPEYIKMPVVLLTKGFYLETEFKRLDDARQTYETFLERFPEDSLAREVQLLLDNIYQDPVKTIINKKK